MGGGSIEGGCLTCLAADGCLGLLVEFRHGCSGGDDCVSRVRGWWSSATYGLEVKRVAAEIGSSPALWW